MMKQRSSEETEERVEKFEILGDSRCEYVLVHCTRDEQQRRRRFNAEAARETE